MVFLRVKIFFIIQPRVQRVAFRRSSVDSDNGNDDEDDDDDPERPL